MYTSGMTRMHGNRLLGAGMAGNTLSGESEGARVAGSLPASGGGFGRGGGFGTRRGARRSGARAALIGGTGISGLAGGSFNIGPINFGGLGG
jgi:hypothetical protein